MTPENWKELKQKIHAALEDPKEGTPWNKLPGIELVQTWMTEIERRTLPERVAGLIENFSHTKLIESETLKPGQDIVHWTNKIIVHALRTGDTSEFEKWQKKV